MSEVIKKINEFFKNAIRDEVTMVNDKLLLTERQEKIFRMYYIQGKDINFIADTLCVCSVVISKELRTIRKKISKVLGIY